MEFLVDKFRLVHYTVIWLAVANCIFDSKVSLH